jgi:hypothetical protein
MLNIELISRVADDYELSPEQAREILFRVKDQEITPGTPPETPPTNPPAEEEEDVTVIYGISYNNEDGTITEEQRVALESLLAATGNSGDAVLSAAMESSGKEDIGQLSSTEAQILIGSLGKASSDPATLWKWSFVQQVVDPWHWLLVLSLGYPMAKKIGERFATRWAERKITRQAARAGIQWGQELAARQTAAGTASRIERTAAERLAAQLETTAQERAVQQLAEGSGARIGASTTERQAAQAGTRLGEELAARQTAARATTQIGTSAAERLAAQAAQTAAKKAGTEAAYAASRTGATVAEQAVVREAAYQAALRASESGAATLGEGAIGQALIKAAPYLARGAGALAASEVGALGSLPVLAATAPFQAWYYYMQPQVEAYLGNMAGARTSGGQYYAPLGLHGWGGYQQGGGGANYGGSGRLIRIPGITDPWVTG